MTKYWPCAKTKDGQQLISSDPALTEDIALNQFNLWKFWYEYDLAKCWIYVVPDHGCPKTRYYELKWTEVPDGQQHDQHAS